MKKTDIINEIFANYLVTKMLYEERKTEYREGSMAQAWHLIFSLDLVNEYFKWEKENEKFYKDSLDIMA